MFYGKAGPSSLNELHDHALVLSHTNIASNSSVYLLGKSFGLFRNELLKFKRRDVRCDMIAGSQRDMPMN